MGRGIKLFAYLGFLAILITSFFPAVIFIVSDYKSADSFEIYGGILFSLIILIFIISSDMKKLRNIIIASILNLVFLFIPATVFYLCLLYGTDFISNQFGDVINTSYISYILSHTRTSAMYSWIGPSIFFNIISILISVLEYLNQKENKSKGNE